MNDLDLCLESSLEWTLEAAVRWCWPHVLER